MLGGMARNVRRTRAGAHALPRMGRAGSNLPVPRHMPAVRPKPGGLAIPNPGRSRMALGKYAKYAAGAVVAAGAVGMYSNRSGRAVDPVRGRPTGIYGY